MNGVCPPSGEPKNLDSAFVSENLILKFRFLTDFGSLPIEPGF